MVARYGSCPGCWNWRPGLVGVLLKQAFPARQSPATPNTSSATAWDWDFQDWDRLNLLLRGASFVAETFAIITFSSKTQLTRSATKAGHCFSGHAFQIECLWTALRPVRCCSTASGILWNL